MNASAARIAASSARVVMLLCCGSSLAACLASEPAADAPQPEPADSAGAAAVAQAAMPGSCSSSSQCNDKNACTVDACVLGRCSSTPGNAGTVCRASKAACDAAEMCTGTSASCPANNLSPSGTVCRAAAGDCDQAETCNGSSQQCPSDAKRPNNAACTDDGNACTLDRCNGSSVLCQHPAGNAGATCRATAGSCDLAETCSGSSTTCPADAFRPSSVVCRVAGSQCDASESCSGGGAQCPTDASLPDGTMCNDGNASTSNDLCTGGQCSGTDLCLGVTCTAADQCHVAGSCNPATGVCSNPAAADGTVCSDSDACTQTDACVAGSCLGDDPVVCTALDQCHDVGSCDSATGVCDDPEKAFGSACNDGDACTQVDTCDTGSCVGDEPVLCTALDQCHDAGACDSATGVCSNPDKLDGSSCSDGDACTQIDSCEAGACTGEDPVVCTALDQCHDAGVCDSASGVCSDPGKPAGTPCDDGNACTASDSCDPSAACAGGPAVDPDDENPCTDDLCDPLTGVQNVAVVGRSCEDGDACTVSDACDEAAACVAAATRNCDDELYCTGVEGCDPASGCTAGTPPDVNDGVECTDDTCDEAADAPAYTPDDAACSNADACDGAEVCDPVTDCGAGTPPQLDDAIACTADACDPALGVSHTPNHALCVDGNVCTADACNTSLGCTFTPLDGTSCTLPGTASAQCTAGSCAVVACDANHGNCDAAAANGCEIDLTTSNQNCGACGTSCASNSHCELGGCVSSGLKLAAGGEHGCVVMADGRVMCWGANGNGQLGDGTTTNRANAVYVSGLSDAIGVDAGFGSDVGETGTGQSCAVRATGGVVCWGGNLHGQLGDGTQAQRTTPVPVVGISDALAVSTAQLHSCALRANGRVMCWGNNLHGFLGDGTVGADILVPVEVANLTDAVAIAAGDETTCALRSTGQLACWGWNRLGEAGVGNTSQQNAPATVTTPTDFIAVAGGGGKTCAIRANHTLMCWGSGIGTTPVAVAGLTGVVDVALSQGNRSHTCAVLDTGGVRCWGANDFGQLGNGTLTASSTPVAVTGISTAVHVACGNAFSCAVLATDHVTCWGRNDRGDLGDGTLVARSTPDMNLLQYPGCTGASCGTPQTGGVFIDGKSNIWGAGSAAPPGGGLLPPIIPLSFGTGAIITFSSVTGTVKETSTAAVGPDGDAGTWPAPQSFGGIAGYTHNTLARSLVGVFLGPITPGAPAPTPLVFADGNFSYLYPQIGQTFFIGDGKTAALAIQEFHVPLGATRLALGLTDLCGGSPPTIGCFSDNTGSYTANYSIAANTPAAVQVDIGRFPNGAGVASNQVISNQWQDLGVLFSARGSAETVGAQGSVFPISGGTGSDCSGRYYFFTPDAFGATGIFRFTLPGTTIPTDATHFEIVPGWQPGESVTLVGFDQNDVATAQQTFPSPGGGNQMIQLDGLFRYVEVRTVGNPGIGFAGCGVTGGYGLRFTRAQ